MEMYVILDNINVKLVKVLRVKIKFALAQTENSPGLAQHVQAALEHGVV